MTASDRVIKNSIFLYGKMGITMFLSLYTTRLILGSLGSTDFGIFNIVGGAIAMLSFFNMALATSIQRFLSVAKGESNIQKEKLIFNAGVVLHGLIAILVAALLIILGYFYFNGMLNIPIDRIDAAKVVYISLIASSFLTILMAPYDAAINANEHMFYYSIIGVIDALLKLGIAYAVVYTTSDKLILYGILTSMITLVDMVCMVVYCHIRFAECRINIFLCKDKKMFHQLTSYIGWNLLSSSVTTFTQCGLSIVVNIFFGVLLNTALGIATQLDAMLKVFSSNMLKALNPIIMKKQGEGNTEGMLRATFTGTKFSFYLFSFFVVPVFINMELIQSIWLGKVPAWSVEFCRLQLITSLIGQLGVTLNSAIAAHGDIKRFSIGTAVIYGLSIILTYFMFYLGLPVFSMYISVIGLNAIAYRILGLFELKDKCDLSILYYCKEVIYPCILVLIVSYVPSAWVASLISNEIIRFFVTGFLSVILFISAFFTVGTSRSEKQKLCSFYDKLRSKYASK